MYEELKKQLKEKYTGCDGAGKIILLDKHAAINNFKKIVWSSGANKTTTPNIKLFECSHEHVSKGVCLYCGEKDIKI